MALQTRRRLPLRARPVGVLTCLALAAGCAAGSSGESRPPSADDGLERAENDNGSLRPSKNEASGSLGACEGDGPASELIAAFQAEAEQVVFGTDGLDLEMLDGKVDELARRHLLPGRSALARRAEWILACLPPGDLPEDPRWAAVLEADFEDSQSLAEGGPGLLLALSWDPVRLAQNLVEQTLERSAAPEKIQLYLRLRHLVPFEARVVDRSTTHPVIVLRSPRERIVIDLEQTDSGYAPRRLRWYKRAEAAAEARYSPKQSDS